MIYFVAEDHYYYTNESIEKLKKEYGLKEIVVLPELKDIKENSNKGEAVGFMSPFPPGVDID